jgi:hypothetical protein
MQTKICKKCGVEKLLNAFNKSKTNKFGVATICRECHCILSPERIMELKERDELLAKGRKVCFKCKQEKAVSEFYASPQTRDGYGIWCKPCVRIYENTGIRGEHKREQKREYSKSPQGEKVNKKRREQPEYLAYNRVYRKTPKAKETTLKRRRQKTKENVNFRLGIRLHSRVHFALKKSKNPIHETEQLIGCTVDFLRTHLESQFTEGMTWDNWSYRGWHIDHILPCRAFDLDVAIQEKACFNWKNLRPMWGIPNISKGFKYSQEDFDKYMDDFIKNNFADSNI